MSLGSNVVKIGSHAFEGCKKLVDLDLNRVEVIGKKAFSGSKSIVNLVLPDTLKDAGESSFFDCSNIKTLKMPITLNMHKHYFNTSFTGCFNIETAILSKGTNGIGYNYDKMSSNSGTPWIDSTKLTTVILEEGVVEIGKLTFVGSHIDTVEFPSTLKKIEKGAFKSTDFKSITIPKGVEVALTAFGNCTKLKEISIPVDLPTVRYPRFTAEEMIFHECTNVEKVTLTEGEKDAYNYDGKLFTPWHNSKNFNTLIVEEGVKNIGRNAFKNCKNLTNVTLPSSLEEIREKAFMNCESIKSIDLHGIKKLGRSAFEDCKGLKSLTIPDSVNSMSRSVFKNCTGLTELTVPVSLNTVVKNDDPAFEGCKNIWKVTLTAGTGHGHEYNDNTHTPWRISKGSFNTLIVSEDVKTIGKNTFKGCDKLGNIQFCDGLESIGKDAFKGFNFFDSDGSTLLSQNADDLKGCTFIGTKSKMVKS